MIQSKIKKIQKITTNSRRYDLEVKNTKNFFANNVLVHNCRVITIMHPSGKVDQFSRNGKELHNFDTVKMQLSTLAKRFSEPMVLDGEIMSSSFQDLMKQVYRKDNVETSDAVLHFFDMLPLADFEKGVCNIPQSTRSEQLKTWFENDGLFLKLLNVRVVGQELVDLDTTEGKQRYLEINKQAIDGGFEGIMLKDPSAPYELKRSVAWLKLKPFISVDLIVTNVEEGTGKYIGSMGAVVCEGTDQGKIIKVNVGSGFTDKQRSEIWLAREDIIGQTVEIIADALTLSQESNIYSLRFPRFSRFRDDK
jgi:DNA ligase-1